MLLIIGASALQHYIYDDARRAGLEVCCVDGDGRAPMFAKADDHRVIDFKDVDAVVRYAREMSVTAVATINLDQGMNSVARITDELGLPGPGPDTVLMTTRKDLMRDHWTREGLPQPRYRVFPEAGRRAAVDFLKRQSQRVIVKPVDNAAKRGISTWPVACSPEPVIANAFAASQVGRIIIEDYVEGNLIFAATYVAAGGSVDVQVMKQTTHGLVQIQFDAPHSFGERIDARIRQTASHAVSAFGPGPFHTEVIVDVDGRPNLVETSPRVSYATVSLSRLSGGFDPVAAVLNDATERSLLAVETTTRLQARLEHLQPTPGSFFRARRRSTPATDAPYEVVALVQAGHRVQALKTNDDRVMYFTVAGRDVEEVEARATRARTSLLEAHFG
jgi:biotin carboxylase